MAKNRICEIEGCGKTHSAKGLCRTHYYRRLRGIDLHKPFRRGRRRPICRIEACTAEHAARGYCQTHYAAWKEDGFHPEQAPTGEKTLSRYIDSNGYVCFSQRGHSEANSHGRVLEHRAVMAEKLGRPLRKGENVHHVNGNRADNRPENLELWVTLQPAGQRVEDLLAYAREIIARYGDDVPERPPT